MDSAAPNLDVLLAEAGWVRALAHSLVRDPAAADDVVQQTWLAALRRPPDTTRPVRPWLGRVVENFARMRARGEAGRERREEGAARPESLASTEDLCARVETQRLLAQEVLALAEPFRSTIVLRYYEGLSAAEIARRVGAPSATVRWRLMRGLELLRGRLDVRHGGDREVWSALLAPLAATAVTKTALKSATGLGVVVARLALLLALLLGLGWLWRSAARRDAGDASPAHPLAAALDRPQSAYAQTDPRLAVRAPIPSRDGPVTRASGTRVVARIVDDELRPLAGARLVVLSPDGSAIAATDGAVELRVAGERRELLAFEGRADGHVAARVDAHLAREGDTYLGDIVLARAGALEGFVGDDLGRPIAGARVRAEIIGSRWKGVSWPPLEEARYVESLQSDAPLALSGADGRYRFEALPRSFVRVWASADGYTTEWSADVSIAVAQTAQTPPFALHRPPPEQRLAGVVLDPSGALVPNAELECARVSLQYAFFRGERGVIRARADEHGRFDFGVDPQSHYDLAARDPAGSFAPNIVAALSPGARDVVVALAPARELAISARDESGAAIAELQVEFSAAAGGKLLQGESEQFVAGVGPVPYVAFNLRVGAPGCAATELGPFEPRSAPAQLDVVLKRAGQLRGSVRGPDGAPIVGARVQLLAVAPGKRARIAPDSVASGEPFALLCDKPGSRAETATDSAGHFALDARVAGNYMTRIDAPGLAGELIGPVHLDAATAIEREVVLKLGGALAGRARRRDGGAVAGSIVGISCGDGWIATARVGPGGEFRFEHLAPRAWQVRHVPRENATDDFEPIAAGNRAPSIAAPTWDAQVGDGSASYCEVFVDADPCVLRGRLLFDGEAPGAWRAELASVAEPNLPPFECALDPDGRFEARVGKPGDYRLRLARITRLGPRLDLTTPIKIDGGVNEWSRDLATATLRITSGAAPKDASKFLVTASAVIDDIVVRGSATLDQNGAVEVTHWPAATMMLWLDSSGEDLPADSEPVTLELRRGEARQVELKRPKNAFEGWR